MIEPFFFFLVLCKSLGGLESLKGAAKQLEDAFSVFA